MRLKSSLAVHAAQLAIPLQHAAELAVPSLGAPWMQQEKSAEGTGSAKANAVTKFWKQQELTGLCRGQRDEWIPKRRGQSQRTGL